MKPILFLTTLLWCSVVAQDTTQFRNIEPPAIEPPKGPVLSSNPTALEFADLFTTGELGESESISRAVEKGESAIAGLKALLFSETIRGPKRQPIEGGMVPNKVAVVLALEGIGTEGSFAVLIQAANTYKGAEVRGAALNALATTYYKKFCLEEATPSVPSGHLPLGGGEPDKGVVEALIKNLDDETYIGFLQKPVNQVAQEGLMRWLGLDFGDPQFEEARIVAAGGKYKHWDPEKENKREPQLSAAAYGKLWWKENKGKLKWSKEKGHFIP